MGRRFDPDRAHNFLKDPLDRGFPKIGLAKKLLLSPYKRLLIRHEKASVLAYELLIKRYKASWGPKKDSPAQFVRFVHSPRQIPIQFVVAGRGGDGRLCSTKPVYK